MTEYANNSFASLKLLQKTNIILTYINRGEIIIKIQLIFIWYESIIILKNNFIARYIGDQIRKAPQLLVNKLTYR